jgi:hypothetical protein
MHVFREAPSQKGLSHIELDSPLPQLDG